MLVFDTHSKYVHNKLLKTPAFKKNTYYENFYNIKQIF